MRASLHVQKIFQEYPDMVHKTDSHGRLTLHHAVSSSSASSESIMDLLQANPMGASARNPVTGLYPFMLAGSIVNVDGSFSLLLANPSLVVGGTQIADFADTKKKKRNISMI